MVQTPGAIDSAQKGTGMKNLCPQVYVKRADNIGCTEWEGLKLMHCILLRPLIWSVASCGDHVPLAVRDEQ